MNIDNIRIENSEKNKNEQLPRHYLLPNVETPYVAGNYSRKKSQSLALVASWFGFISILISNPTLCNVIKIAVSKHNTPETTYRGFKLFDEL